MFYEYVNILNKGDILIILVSGFSILPHQNKYLWEHGKIKNLKKENVNVQVMEICMGENEHLMKWIRKNKVPF